MEERGTLHLMGVTTFMYQCCINYGNQFIVALDTIKHTFCAITNVGFGRKDYVNRIHLFSTIFMLNMSTSCMYFIAKTLL